MKTIILNGAKVKNLSLKGASKPFGITSYFVWIEDSQTGQNYKMVVRNNNSAYFDLQNCQSRKTLANIEYHKTN